MNIVDQQTFRDAMSCMGAAVNIITTDGLRACHVCPLKKPAGCCKEQTMNIVDQQTFRDAMSCMGAAVNIITTDGPAGRAGFTASAVCSVTDTPPTLLVEACGLL